MLIHKLIYMCVLCMCSGHVNIIKNVAFVVEIVVFFGGDFFLGGGRQTNVTRLTKNIH